MRQQTSVNENKAAYTKKTYYMVLEPKDLPYNSQFIPLGTCVLNYTSRASGTITTCENAEIECKALQLFGQSFGHFKLSAKEPTTFLGVHLNPSTIYKVFGKNLESLKSQSFSHEFEMSEVYTELQKIFGSFNGDLDQFNKEINRYFSSKDTLSCKYMHWIDECILSIERKKGVIQVKDLMEKVPFSQKTLELKFKEIIGLTPGQFIRQTRFLNYLKDYHTSGHTNKELIYYYHYYDQSHLSKEVRHFTGESPKTYFDSQFSELKKCINF